LRSGGKGRKVKSFNSTLGILAFDTGHGTKFEGRNWTVSIPRSEFWPLTLIEHNRHCARLAGFNSTLGILAFDTGTGST